MDKELLLKYKIDFEKGVSRCMDDAEFYEELLSMFLQDASFENAKLALKKKNYSRMFECVHELKGTCSNIALNGLYEVVCPLTELLRGGGMPDEAEVKRLFTVVEKEYAQACKGISLAITQQVRREG